MFNTELVRYYNVPRQRHWKSTQINLLRSHYCLSFCLCRNTQNAVDCFSVDSAAICHLCHPVQIVVLLDTAQMFSDAAVEVTVVVTAVDGTESGCRLTSCSSSLMLSSFSVKGVSVSIQLSMWLIAMRNCWREETPRLCRAPSSSFSRFIVVGS